MVSQLHINIQYFTHLHTLVIVYSVVSHDYNQLLYLGFIWYSSDILNVHSKQYTLLLSPTISQVNCVIEEKHILSNSRNMFFFYYNWQSLFFLSALLWYCISLSLLLEILYCNISGITWFTYFFLCCKKKFVVSEICSIWFY